MTSLGSLISTPFMLNIIVRVLPQMDRDRGGKTVEPRRIDLFDAFVNQLFQREADKSKQELKAAQSARPIRYFFQVDATAIKEDYQMFCEGLAGYLYTRQQVTVLYQ